MITLPKEKEKSNFIYRRKIIDMTLDLLCHELENIDWDFIIKCTIVDRAYNTFIDLFKAKLDEICPLVKIQFSTK